MLDVVIRGSVTFIALLVTLRIVGQREAGGFGITGVLLVVLVAEAAAAGLHEEASSVADGLPAGGHDPVLERRVRRRRLPVAPARPAPQGSTAAAHQGRGDQPRGAPAGVHDSRRGASQLRLHGIEDPAEVERASIEPNGMISIVRRDREEPEDPVRRRPRSDPGPRPGDGDQPATGTWVTGPPDATAAPVAAGGPGGRGMPAAA
ncbi:YetF domain-containing protein [Geodermatophilus sp. URMC 64]